MSAIFFLVLIVVLAGLAGLALQNLSVSISLVFLGLQLQPIPLGYLILGAIAAGVVTGLVVIGLLNLSNYLSRRRLQRTPTEEPRPRPQWQRNTDTNNQTNDADTWGAEPEQTNFEAEQQPKATHQSGSTYSYSYRDEKETGVGRPESVVDAEYRVVTPPYQVNNTDDEDYGFDFDDEDFEDDENSEGKGKPRSQH